MTFTLWALVVPFAVFVALTLAERRGVRDPFLHALGVASVCWLLVGLMVTPIYWIARVVRRAWRDGAAHERDG